MALSLLIFQPATFTASRLLNQSANLSKEASRATLLPQPTGSYHLGTTIFHLIDTSRKDILGEKPDRSREIMLQVWYPAETSKQQTAAYFLDGRLIDSMKKDGFYDQKPEVMDAWRGVKTHSVLNAPIKKTSQKLPLLLFSHGLGMPRSHYTSLVEEMASYGYIVVAIDHPSGGLTILPDGRVLTAIAGGEPEEAATLSSLWAGDASFVIDRLLDSKDRSVGRFATHIDQSRIGMFGHSLGGAAAIEAGLTDKRLKACVDMDGAPFGRAQKEGIACHTMVLGSSPDYSDEDLARRGRTREQWEEMGRKGRAMYEAVFQNRNGKSAYRAKINGTGHLSFSDAPFVMPDTITRFGGRIIAPARGFEIMSAYLRAFFDQYLSGKPSSLLDGPNKLYPEVSIEIYGK